MAKLLKEHLESHPDMEVRDAIKFLHQSRMGPGHLIAGEEEARSRLEAEWARVEGDPAAPMTEPLGGGMCRLLLSGCKGRGLSSETALRLFLLTAGQVSPDLPGLDKDLELLYALPFPRETVSPELERYRALGCPPVGHSQRYRGAYSPAYRVISRRLARLLPLLCAIDREMARTPFVRTAIDGPCASGKSTLGEELAQIYRCPLLHMDDFFLRPEQRTEERLAQPGGNVDYERFDREALAPLCRGEEARFRPWRCREGAFGPELVVRPSPQTVIEGSYSLHPALRDRFQLRVWLEADMDARLARLSARGGPGCMERFRKVWIPLEDRYFAACRVKECCQLQISGADAH